MRFFQFQIVASLQNSFLILWIARQKLLLWSVSRISSIIIEFQETVTNVVTEFLFIIWFMSIGFKFCYFDDFWKIIRYCLSFYIFQWFTPTDFWKTSFGPFSIESNESGDQVSPKYSNSVLLFSNFLGGKGTLRRKP